MSSKGASTVRRTGSSFYRINVKTINREKINKESDDCIPFVFRLIKYIQSLLSITHSFFISFCVIFHICGVAVWKEFFPNSFFTFALP